MNIWKKKIQQGFPPLVIDSVLFVFLIKGCKVHPSMSYEECFQKPDDIKLPQYFSNKGEQAQKTVPLLWPKTGTFFF